ncbi:prepilin-type N-terminal cleavage/methylation domain-containing protein [uncultured Shimia sp.]|uniref:prepilin-type N-terminal cleavage/methylation domain-containing protein n=1 Tax=uncultured Shimia sp. TaxID=573152 RepID=UPI0025DF42E2|nr:prepilin-type N-terminal cleavage/methylation domain-containing protein [uncultured Shimia sp.]
MGRAITSDNSAGFSLIELLIAVAVMAVLAVGASLSIGRMQSGIPQDQALFQRNFDRLKELAITSGQRRGMKITPKGMQLATRTPQGWQVSEQILNWRDKVTITSRPVPANAPDLEFLANGETTAFTIAFSRKDNVGRCQSDGFLGLTCE